MITATVGSFILQTSADWKDPLVIAAYITGVTSLVVQLFMFLRVRGLQQRDHDFQSALQEALAKDRKEFEAQQETSRQSFERELKREVTLIEEAQKERDQRRQHELDQQLEEFKTELSLWREATPKLVTRVQTVRSNLDRACDALKMLAFSFHTWDDQEMVEHSSTVLQSLSALFTRSTREPDLPVDLRPAFSVVRSALARMFLAFHVVKELRDLETTRADIKSSWDALATAREEFIRQADRFEQTAHHWNGNGSKHILIGSWNKGGTEGTVNVEV